MASRYPVRGCPGRDQLVRRDRRSPPRGLQTASSPPPWGAGPN